MASVYVAKDGSDSNNGSSWALAKKTIAGAFAVALTNGDVIEIGPGHYLEEFGLNLNAVPRGLTFRGREFVLIEALNPFNPFTHQTGQGHGTFYNNLEFRGFHNQIITVAGSNPTQTVYADNCRFFGGSNAIYSYYFGSRFITNCLFHKQTGPAVYSVYGNGGYVEYCTFYKCYMGVHEGADGGYNSRTPPRVRNCLFYDSRIHLNMWLTPANVPDYNLYYPFDATHQNTFYVAGAVAYSSLASSQNLVNSNDANSRSESPELLDPENFLYGLTLGSTQGRRGQDGSRIGYGYNAYGMSPGVNASIFENPAATSNLTRDATTGYWGLTPGQTVGTYWTQVIDLGERRLLRRLGPIGQIYGPLDVFDYSTGDAAPRDLTFRYRSSLTSFVHADVAPAWVEHRIGADSGGVAARYLQGEITLRKDGP